MTPAFSLSDYLASIRIRPFGDTSSVRQELPRSEGAVFPGSDTAPSAPQAPDTSLGGRAALGAALTNNNSAVNNTLGIMGLFSGPIGNLALSGLTQGAPKGPAGIFGGLRGMMAAHNAQTLEAQLTQLTPAQRAQIDPVTAHNITTTIGTFDVLGQMQSPAMKSQRQGERNPAPRPNAPDETVDEAAPPGPPPGVPSDEGNPSGPAGAPGSSAGGPSAGSGTGAPGGNSGSPSGGGDSGNAGDFHQGGLIPDRQQRPNLEESITAQEGEFVVRRGPAEKYSKLLSAINAGHDGSVKRALKEALTA